MYRPILFLVSQTSIYFIIPIFSSFQQKRKEKKRMIPSFLFSKTKAYHPPLAT